MCWNKLTRISFVLNESFTRTTHLFAPSILWEKIEKKNFLRKLCWIRAFSPYRFALTLLIEFICSTLDYFNEWIREYSFVITLFSCYGIVSWLVDFSSLIVDSFHFGFSFFFLNYVFGLIFNTIFRNVFSRKIFFFFGINFVAIIPIDTIPFIEIVVWYMNVVGAHSHNSGMKSSSNIGKWNKWKEWKVFYRLINDEKNRESTLFHQMYRLQLLCT